jgi:hypothetical protein
MYMTPSSDGVAMITTPRGCVVSDPSPEGGPCQAPAVSGCCRLTRTLSLPALTSAYPSHRPASPFPAGVGAGDAHSVGD